MSRSKKDLVSIALAAVVAVTGCAPTQPFYFMEDGDLSHYVDVATEIDYPDVESPRLDEVSGAMAPLTLKNLDSYEFWDLSLEEVTRITLTNSQVMRQVGGVVQENAPETISRNLINNVAVATTYDPALTDSATGTAFGSAFNGTGTEAALSAFDAQWDASVSWQRNDRPQNVGGIASGFQAANFVQEASNFSTGVSKTTAVGSQFGFRNNTRYDGNTNLIRQGAPAASQWETNFEAFFNQPLLQGAGAQYNRIAGPFAFEQYAQNGFNNFDGVVLARIRTDLTLADFEGAARNVMRDAEQAYWTLYFTYRDLESRKIGRDAALQTWKSTAAKRRQGYTGGSAGQEAQARTRYYEFEAQVEQGISALFTAENRLRYIMGLTHTDGRLVRPSDEPTTARVDFDWHSIHGEALVRRVEVRKQKWEIKRREMELIAARNHLLPRLDAFGTYRWLGAADRLFEDNPAAGATPFQPGTGAFNVLTGGDFTEWELGMRFSLPIGFRQQLSTVRFHQLALARERELLRDLELEVSHQVSDAVRDLDLHYGLAETNFNRSSSAEEEVVAVEALYTTNKATLDTLLDAQRRRSDAKTAYYRSLIDYNLALVDIHYRKGSLLEYNGVYLAEGPWPGKASFDAARRARQRDASLALDYGFTRPGVISRGPHAQRQGTPNGTLNGGPMGVAAPQEMEILSPTPAEIEEVPPAPEPMPLGAAGARGDGRVAAVFAAPGAPPAGEGQPATGYETVDDTTNQTSAAVTLASHTEGGAQPAGGWRAEHGGSGRAVNAIYERQAAHPTNRPAAAPAVGAGR